MKIVNATVTVTKNVHHVQMMFVQLANVIIAEMKIKEVTDYFYGLDPAHMSYRHKIGDIYGKKNLKVPHAKLHVKNKKKKQKR